MNKNILNHSYTRMLRLTDRHADPSVDLALRPPNYQMIVMLNRLNTCMLFTKMKLYVIITHGLNRTCRAN